MSNMKVLLWLRNEDQETRDSVLNHLLDLGPEMRISWIRLKILETERTDPTIQK